MGEAKRIELLKSRQGQVKLAGRDFDMACEKASVAGSVSQRACGFCGSRVVLYPIADALHLVHGPIGCAAYTWDIRGALSSGPELHRLSFSTDLQERDVVYGGEAKLKKCLDELIEEYKPRGAFVYVTCIVGLIGDDVDSICRKMSEAKGIPVIPVHSEGFKGSKKDGYRSACAAIGKLVGTLDAPKAPKSINILGDFNLAGEIWIIKDYYKRIGVEVVATITGDGRVDDVRKAHCAALNVVQCAGSMTSLAMDMKEKYAIPYLRVSYFGIEDMAKALYDVADFFGDEEMLAKARALVKEELSAIMPEIAAIRKDLTGRKAAVYTGGAFKVFSLVRSLKSLGVQTVLAGSQTGSKEDYKLLGELCDEGTVLVDDTNPVELAKFILEKRPDVFIGGVKERPLAYKLGVGFCDHNHERKEALAGFAGMLNFAREVHASIMSPVWTLIKEETGR